MYSIDRREKPVEVKKLDFELCLNRCGVKIAATLACCTLRSMQWEI